MVSSSIISLVAYLKNPRISGIILLFSACLGPVLASSPVKGSWHYLLNSKPFSPLPLTIGEWISHGLMSIFFLSLALEIRHALVEGPLDHWRKAALPLAGALGGMTVPGAIAAICGLYLPVTAFSALYDPAGWAIPTATDAAFTVPIMAMLPFLPANLRVFLMALAIFDDLGAILIMALFYGHNPDPAFLAAGLVPLGLMILLSWRHVQSLWAYLLPAAILWFLLEKSGIEPTLAGVALGFCLPVHKGEKLNQALILPLGLLILPLFAMISTEIDLGQFHPAFLVTAPFLGTALGLFIGKPLGICGFVILVNRLGILPEIPSVRGMPLFGVSMLCGIGFTISLLIAQLAYSDQTGLMEARCGVLAGSIFSALLGWALLKIVLNAPPVLPIPQKEEPGLF